MKFAAALLISSCAFIAIPMKAQSSPAFDNSGNNQLSGNYFFREVLYIPGDAAGNLSQAASAYGTIQFDGNGNYTVNGFTSSLATSGGAPQSLTVSGTYVISASGLGYIESTVSGSSSQGLPVYGLTSPTGTFIGSSTESDQNELFIAVPAGSPLATNADFRGSYTIAAMDLPTATPADARDSLFTLSPDGGGNVSGPVSVSGYVAGGSGALVTQTVSNLQYSFVNGAGTLFFPATGLNSQTLISGNKEFYISPDGTFLFGGSTNGFDMFVGTTTFSGTGSNSSFRGLFYSAGLDQDVSTIGSNQTSLSTYYGSLNATNGVILEHERINSVVNQNAFDYTFSDGYTINADGSYTPSNSSLAYVLGANGTVRITSGKYPFLGLSAALQAPVFSSGGVFLDPTGIVNAASSAPFTAGISPGELLTMYGTNLAPSTQVATTVPFPTNLGGVQVMINGIAAPVFVVSSGQISAFVPYSLNAAVAQIQVINNGSASNAVTAFTSSTSPGVFTIPAGGVGDGAIVHLDYKLVSPSDPALVGETLAAFVAGLGPVSPAVADGDVGPTSPLSETTNNISVFVDGQEATIPDANSGGFIGLAPGLAGLYQINFQVPSNIRSGDVYFDVSGPDSYTSQAIISIAAGAGTTGAVTKAKLRSSPKRMSLKGSGFRKVRTAHSNRTN